MPECSLPWGEEQLTLPLPDHWTLEQVATPRPEPAPANWDERFAAALNRPEGSVALAALLREIGPDGRIVLAVEDITRHSPLTQILPIILREISHAGISDSQVSIIFATGMHPAMTEDQVRDKIGTLADCFAWRCNDARDLASHVHVGDVSAGDGRGVLAVRVDKQLVEADLRIVISSVAPHLQAGFGGGAKMFVPGCAHIETIAQVHSLGLPRKLVP